MFHLKTKVDLAGWGTVDVSTVDLNLTGWTTGKGFETCLFFGDGDSEVVGWYANQQEAAAGHAAFSSEAVIRFLLEIRDTRDSYQEQLVVALQEIDKLKEAIW